MTNHEPTEKETFIKRIGKKKKAFKIKSWKDEYALREKIKIAERRLKKMTEENKEQEVKEEVKESEVSKEDE